ncbi:Uncharacterised protein [Zhongshania aliphaticivorans]|nr:Uncharacterised protein [Zhongshania aliphaticivorans]
MRCLGMIDIVLLYLFLSGLVVIPEKSKERRWFSADWFVKLNRRMLK